MEDETWADDNMRCFGMLIDGRAQPTGLRKRGEDATLLLVMNGHHDLVEFTLPEVTGGGEWSLKMDTNLPTLPDDNALFATGNVYGVTGRSVLVFMLASDKIFVMGSSPRKITEMADRRGLLRQCRNLKMARSAHAMSAVTPSNSTNGWKRLKPRSFRKDRRSGFAAIAISAIFGPIADKQGLIDFEIRDLDQTVIGNPAHDLIRLGLSLATAARGSDLPGVTTAHMLEEMTLGYEEALAEEDPDFRSQRPNCVRAVMRQAVGRTWENLARERIADVRPTIRLGKRFGR